MPQINPFRGLRFDPDRVGDVSRTLSPPYDVISPVQQQALMDQSPYNIVRVELSQDAPGDSEKVNRYTRAADELSAWRAEGALREDPRPAFYLLAHTFSWAGKTYTRHGLFVAVRLHPWADGAVLPHESTFSGPKEDRYKLLSETQTNVSPVFMVYRQEPDALRKARKLLTATPAALDASLDGERLQLWVVDNPETVDAISKGLAPQTLYIADGHHRYETALRYRDERAAAGTLEPDGPASFVLSYIAPMDDPGLVVLPTHRLVRDVTPERVWAAIDALGDSVVLESVPLGGRDTGEAFQAVQSRLNDLGRDRPAFAVLSADSDSLTIVALRAPDVMVRAAPDAAPAWRALDVAALQTLILDALLPSHEERDASIVYARDAQAALDAVRSGDCQVAFIMNTPSVEGMANVADARARMPEKSTYFFPKVPTGLVMRSIA